MNHDAPDRDKYGAASRLREQSDEHVIKCMGDVYASVIGTGRRDGTLEFTRSGGAGSQHVGCRHLVVVV